MWWHVYPLGFLGAEPEAVEGRTVHRLPDQQERWLYHCGDAAAFLGLAEHDELESHPDGH